MYKTIVTSGIRKPRTISVTHGLPNMGCQITEIDIDNFARENNFNWTEDIQIPHMDYLGPPFEYQSASIDGDLVSLLIHSKRMVSVSNVIVGKMDAAIGYGVFAKAEIKRNDILGLYAGVIRSLEGMSPTNQKHVVALENLTDFFRGASCIDAGNNGNITRFLQDLPRADELNNYIFATADLREAVALENLVATVADVSVGALRLRVPVIRVLHTIKKNEQLGYSYSAEGYWNTVNYQRLFFDHYGKILNPAHYKPRYIDIDDNDNQCCIICNADAVTRVLSEKTINDTARSAGWQNDSYYPFLSATILYFYQRGWGNNGLDQSRQARELVDALGTTLNDCIIGVDTIINNEL